MKIHYILASVGMMAGLLAACTTDESDIAASNEKIVVYGHILSPAEDMPTTRTEIDNTKQETDVHTLWVADDRIGLFNTAGNASKLYRTQLQNVTDYTSTTNAEFAIVNGDAFASTSPTMHYAFYPYNNDPRYPMDFTRESGKIPANTATVEWTLANEQDWYNYASISDRDWMVSKAGEEKNSGVWSIYFRPVTTLLRFMVEIDPVEENDLLTNRGMLEYVTIEPATGTEADFPYLTGTYKFDLTYLDQFTDAQWRIEEGQESYIPLTGMWSDPQNNSGSKSLRLNFKNVSSINTPTRAYANIAPVLRTTHKVKVTIHTDRAILTADNLTVQTDFQAGKVYTIPLFCNNDTKSQWTVEPLHNDVNIDDTNKADWYD